MANNKMIVQERQTELGNFIVDRLLPFRRKRQVGPFTFIDHMGPSIVQDGKYVDVDQHPHIGLSTLTYLLEGEIEHKDSTGASQIIKAGDIGWMTAGSGVTHTERTPQNQRDGQHYNLHGYQIWVALPKAIEEMPPRFDFYSKEEMPHWQQENLSMKLIAGQGFGRVAPLEGYSPLFMVDIFAQDDAVLDLRGHVNGEVAFVIVKGAIISSDQKVEAGQMLISKTNDECEIHLMAQTQVLLFGGVPLPEERYLSWNFVSHSIERLQQAKEDWINRRFPTVEGDHTYIPYPIAKVSGS